MKLRQPLAIAGLAWTVMVSGADDRTAPGPLATAKQEFDALKTARPATDPKAVALTHLTAPEFAAPADAPKPVRVAPPAAKADKNWLVDGVMRQTAADPRSHSSQQGAQTTEVQTGEEKNPVDSTMKAAPNPLAQYLSGWISTQDRSMLLTSTNASADALGAALGTLGGLGKETDERFGRATWATPLASGERRFVPPENPYLQTREALSAAPLNPVAPPLVANQTIAYLPTAPVVPPRTGARSILEPPAAPLPNQERSRPAEEQKYFRQLKRF